MDIRWLLVLVVMLHFLLVVVDLYELKLDDYIYQITLLQLLGKRFLQFQQIM